MTVSRFHHQTLYMIAKIDDLINAQLSKIIHHDAFQEFEARWRSLAYLVEQTQAYTKVKIKVFNASKKALIQDLCQQVEFDQSILFDRVYNDEFGHPGGEPFNILVSDLYFSHHFQDVDLLNHLAQLATAAFCPFIAGVHAHFLGVDNLKELGTLPRLDFILKQSEYRYWRRMQQREDSRFLSLTVGRHLLRKPYKTSHQGLGRFCYRDPESDRDYIWGNSAFALAAVIARAFDYSGWFADIIGHETEAHIGANVPITPVAQLDLYEQTLSKQFNAEVGISSLDESTWSALGLIPLCQSYPWCENVFYSCQTVHQTPAYSHESAVRNAQLSTQLNYLLCGSRFAHYIKILGRNKIGSFATAMECEHFLTQWLFKYTVNNDVSVSQRTEFPLQSSHVKVKSVDGKPGFYRCVIHLKPHFQLENITATLMLTTELAGGAKK